MTLVVVLALLLDQFLGEPRRLHPLVGFGSLAAALEASWNKGDRSEWCKLRGMLALLLLTLPPVMGVHFLEQEVGVPFQVAVLYLCLGGRSLVEHARAVTLPLACSNLDGARAKVAKMVSRETGGMKMPAIIAATIESVLENGTDAVFGTLFWFLIAGAPGALFYRLVNTLDAMWGYRTPRFRQFGWSAARLDDLLNWLPARLTAAGYAMAGGTAGALHSWRHHAHLLESPNGGAVMSAGAGALGIRLGGPAVYHGVERKKPWFGGGFTPLPGDIFRTIDLLHLSLFYWILLLLLGEYWFA